MSLELTLFQPESPYDDEAVAQFNALRRDAIGLHQPKNRPTNAQEWALFHSSHQDAREYVASHEDTPIAVAARIRLTKQGRIANLLSIAVAPRLRSRSLGSQALQQIEQICHNERMRVIRVTALDSAQSFYKKHDYDTVGEEGNLVFMKKQLNQ